MFLMSCFLYVLLLILYDKNLSVCVLLFIMLLEVSVTIGDKGIKLQILILLK